MKVINPLSDNPDQSRDPSTDAAPRITSENATAGSASSGEPAAAPAVTDSFSTNAANLPEANQAASPSEATAPKPTSSIYPDPDLAARRNLPAPASSTDSAEAAPGFALSRLGIPLIVTAECVYGIIVMLESFSGVAGFALGSPLFRYVALMQAFIVAIMVLAIFFSYKTYRGSKVALAFLTSPLAIVLAFDFLGGLMSMFSAYSSLNFWSSFWVVANIILAVLLVLAWTKDKDAYV